MSKKSLLNILAVVFIFIFLCSCNNETEMNVVDSNEVIDTITYEERISELQDKIIELNESILEKDTKIEQFNNEKSKLENDIHNQEISINYLTEEIEYIRKYLDAFLKNLNEDELLEVAIDEWEYSMCIEYVNTDGDNIIIPIESQMNLDISSFSLKLIERMPSNPLLKDYQDIFMRGQLDNYRAQINLVDSERYNWEENGSDGTVVTAKIIDIYDLDEGTTVVFNITDLLMERLNLQSNSIKISIR